MACALSAAPKSAILSVAVGTNATATATTTAIAGYIDELVLELPTGATTGTVAVVATQPMGNAVTLASKAITADTLVRLGVDFTSTDGTGLTSDEPRRYYSYGDSITATFSVMDTGVTWRVWIKYDDDK